MDKERDKSKARFTGRYNKWLGKRFQEHFKQYLIKCEGEGLELEELEDLDEVFTALVINYKAKTE